MHKKGLLLLWALLCTSLPLHSALIAGQVYKHGNRSKKEIALTFDDGPDEPFTSEVLAILKKNNIKATFFMIGENVEASPQTAKAVRQAECPIGNHTYTHPKLEMLPFDAVHEELAKAENAIVKATEKKPTLMRPPHGIINETIIEQAKAMGYPVIKWDVTGVDWRRDIKSEEIIENVMGRVQNGSIILLHDGVNVGKRDRREMINALPKLIMKLRERGFKFVTVEKLLR